MSQNEQEGGYANAIFVESQVLENTEIVRIKGVKNEDNSDRDWSMRM